MKKRIALGVVVFLTIFVSVVAQDAERRVALVIGNADYESSPLENPANDARDMTAALQELGFSVTTKVNITARDMTEAIRDFGIKLTEGGVGLFYYAGHGMQVEGRNYLIPVDADIQAEDEVKFFAVDVGLMLSKMDTAGNRINIVILDSCRDNPFKRSFRSFSRGLVAVDAPRGSLIIYATSPGGVSADGEGRNGVFTGALLNHIKTPDVDVEVMLKEVRGEVMAATGGEQTPWSTSSLSGTFYFAGEERISTLNGEHEMPDASSNEIPFQPKNEIAEQPEDKIDFDGFGGAGLRGDVTFDDSVGIVSVEVTSYIALNRFFLEFFYYFPLSGAEKDEFSSYRFNLGKAFIIPFTRIIPEASDAVSILPRVFVSFAFDNFTHTDFGEAQDLYDNFVETIDGFRFGAGASLSYMFWKNIILDLPSFAIDFIHTDAQISSPFMSASINLKVGASF